MDDLVVPVRRTVLPSGARILTDRMPEAWSVSVSCWVGVGSRDETEALAGTSHFLEHLLFKGSERRTAREISRAVDGVGGDLNAFTTRELTAYHGRLPAAELELGVDVLVDLVTSPAFRSDEVESERQVILEELAAAADEPDDEVARLLAEGLFPDHPLGREVAGSADSVRGLTREAVAGFHRSRYDPANLVFAVAGRVDHDEVVRLIDSRLGEGEGGARPDRRAPALPPAPAFVVERDHEQVHLGVGWRGLAHDDDDRFALAVLNHALGGGVSSRLFHEVREERGLVYWIGSGTESFDDSGFVGITTSTQPEHVATVLELIGREVADVAANGLSDEELTVAIGALCGSLVLSLEDSAGRMARLGYQELVRDHVMPVAEQLGRLRSVGHREVMEVANRVFGAPPTTVGVGPVAELPPLVG